MRTALPLSVCLFLLMPAGAHAATELPTVQERPQVARPGPGVLISSSSSSASLARREVAGPDTFMLYGGPAPSTEGKFQLADRITPDWGDGSGLLNNPSNYGGGPGAWSSHDLLDLPFFWHRSTYGADALGGPGNHVLWCGTGAGDPNEAPVVGWATPPGYGNGWRDRALFEYTMVDAGVGQTVTLDFDFVMDTEPAYDYFVVAYDSAGSTVEVFRRDGSGPATTFGAEAPGNITYSPDGYGGVAGDQIRIWLEVQSDGAWSDQDGLWPSDGAARVDNIDLSFTDGVDAIHLTEDFEAEQPDATFLFAPVKGKFAGDFAEVYPSITDLDPCRDNFTPAIGFIDFGQTVRNWRNHPDYLASGDSTTGGSAGASYGIPGGFVVNYSGGLSLGEVNVRNEVWSPWIAWDLPTPEDDGIDVSGALLRYDVWIHLPLANGYFYVWHIRSLDGEPGVDAPESWMDPSFVYYGGSGPVWSNLQYDVSVFLPGGTDYLQIALGAWDYADVFGFPGTAATPSPVFDNVTVAKYRIAGPSFLTRTINQAQDGFPANGSIDPADPDLLDIPFDMAQDVNSGDLIIEKGDSVVVDVESGIPGATVTDIRMVWALKQSTALSFNEVQPSRPKDENFQDLGGGIWTGEVVADTSRTSTGGVIDGRYFFDLPDEDFLHPGAVLHYYIQASDSDDRTTTLPAETAGFGDFSRPDVNAYDRRFTVRGLPSLSDAGSQPELLIWNDFGHRGGEAAWLTAMYELGAAEGVDYDTYTTKGPSSNVSNGIGTANPGQLDGYHHMIYLAGNLSTGLISDGSSSAGNDKADDLAVLQDWISDVSGVRNVALFGDFVALANSQTGGGMAFVQDVMGVDVLGWDVRPVIGGQTAPMVIPNPGAAIPAPGTFQEEYVVYGGCLSINQFDQIQPLTGGEAGHWFTDAGGAPITDPGAGVASVINNHGNGVSITFPYSCVYVFDPVTRTVGPSARTRLFSEVLELFSIGSGLFPPLTPVPELRPSVLSLQPNPFNPSTQVSFTNTFGKTGSVKVFNLRGELVRTLHEGEFTQADGFTKTWDGRDDGGASVASGVYVIQARADGEVATKKAALVK